MPLIPKPVSAQVPKIDVFIDSNIFLNFYGFAKEDLKELEKLRRSITNRSMALYVTQQVVDEVWRNRESQIAKILSRLESESQRIPRQYPVFARDEGGPYEDVRQAETAWQKARGVLVGKLRDRALGHRLEADRVIRDIFESVPVWERNDDVVEMARRRVEIGNPPGKRGSFGDALNWEILKKAVPRERDLIVVSEDGDFRSDLDKTRVNPFLKEEWKRDKEADVTLYTSLPDFVVRHQKDVDLRVEQKRISQQDRLVSRLETSGSFGETHEILSRLIHMFPFTDGNVESVLVALRENNQVGWICDDPDVKAFFMRIWREQRGAIPTHLVGELLARYTELGRDSDEDDEVPF